MTKGTSRAQYSLDGIPSKAQSISGKGPGSALESAASYLRGVFCPDGSRHEVYKIEHAQWEALRSYCEASQLILSRSIQPGEKGGSEHDIGYDERTGRVLKFTKPHNAGLAMAIYLGSRVSMRRASPLQYLDRWRIGNRLFKDDVELVGLSLFRGSEPRIVVSQQTIAGDAATWEEIEEYFVSNKGFREIRPPGLDSCTTDETKAYWRGRYAVFDARPPNCLRSRHGEVLPIDVIPMVCTRNEATWLSRFVVEAWQRGNLNTTMSEEPQDESSGDT